MTTPISLHNVNNPATMSKDIPDKDSSVHVSDSSVSLICQPALENEEDSNGDPTVAPSVSPPHSRFLSDANLVTPTLPSPSTFHSPPQSPAGSADDDPPRSAPAFYTDAELRVLDAAPHVVMASWEPDEEGIRVAEPELKPGEEGALHPEEEAESGR